MRLLFLISSFSVGISSFAIAQEIEPLPVADVSLQEQPVVEEVSEGVVPVQPEVQLLEEPVNLEADLEVKQLVPHSGLYFDADSIVPDSALGASAGPREVDPKYEPGSRFVVVKKDAGSKSFKARMVAADRALKLGRYTSALEIYEQLYKKSPKNHSVLMGLAIAQQNSGFTESAIATYEELLRHQPKNTEAMVNMLGLIKKQYPAVAYRKLKDLWQQNGRNPAIAAQLGLTSAESGNTQEALQYLGVAASMEPNNASHYYNMAVVADRAGGKKEAVSWYEKALEIDVMHGNSRSIPRDQVYDRLAHLRRL